MATQVNRPRWPVVLEVVTLCEILSALGGTPTFSLALIPYISSTAVGSMSGANQRGL